VIFINTHYNSSFNACITHCNNVTVNRRHYGSLSQSLLPQVDMTTFQLVRLVPLTPDAVGHSLVDVTGFESLSPVAVIADNFTWFL